MSQLIYLDNAATTAVRPEVFEKMKPFFIENYSNPSAVYSFAGDTKEAVERQENRLLPFLVQRQRKFTLQQAEVNPTTGQLKVLQKHYRKRVSTLSLRRLNITQCCIPVSIWKSTAMK